MKYLNLIWKLFFWNLVCFIGTIVFLAFFVGEPSILLFLTFIISPIVGTIGGLVEYKRSQRMKKLSTKSSQLSGSASLR